jgi:hypothetical protein
MLLYLDIYIALPPFMDIRTEILQEHSKQQTEKIAAWVGSDKKRLSKLMDIFLDDEPELTRRAGWILCYVNDKYLALLHPYLEAMVKKMSEPGMHVAVKRHVIRMLQTQQIPESLQGEIMTVCFDFLADPKETVAVRCFSMSVLDNLSKDYPEIRQELITIIQDQLEQETTAGFRSRAKKILNKKR